MVSYLQHTDGNLSQLQCKILKVKDLARELKQNNSKAILKGYCKGV